MTPTKSCIKKKVVLKIGERLKCEKNQNIQHRKCKRLSYLLGVAEDL